MTHAAAIRLRLLASVLSLLLIGALLVAGGFWWLARRNLPPLDGEAELPGLSATVTVERDALGVPTIRGAARADVARTLGYLHVQDRFFQMDLLRRRSAGELSELFGRTAVPHDREMRVHGFRALARQSLALLPPGQRALVDAYTAGVNAGLSTLRAWPFEYYVLRVRPQPWVAEDTVLVGYSMVLDLQDVHDKYELTLAAIQDCYGHAMLDFLAPRGTGFDAALDGGTFPSLPLPGPEIIDLRKQKPRAEVTVLPWLRPARQASASDEFAPGSNAFALAGRRTANGSALLANDMHLHLGVPNIWYRASLIWSEETPNPEPRTESPRPGDAHRVTGVTLPGTPLVIAGSNGRIAWGFTNSFADTTDIVIVEPSRIDPHFYKNGNDTLEM